MTTMISSVTVRRMRLELDRLEAQARQEQKERKTRAMGTLRMDLVEECRRRLFLISTSVKDRARKTSAFSRIQIATKNLKGNIPE